MALHIAATGTSILAELALIAAPACEMGQRLFAAIRVRIQDVLDPYRPELHYMRGPGPRWREKQGVAPATGRASRFGVIEALDVFKLRFARACILGARALLRLCGPALLRLPLLQKCGAAPPWRPRIHLPVQDGIQAGDCSAA